MTDLPILFSAPMVTALLAGRKTQTRRVLKPQPEHLQVYDWKGKRLHDSEYRHWCWKGHVGADNWDDITTQLRPFLPYAVGDRLYVREALSLDESDRLTFAAGSAPVSRDQMPPGFKVSRRTVPGMFMPRWASRITLTVTDVRVQRVNEISRDDAIAEGLNLASSNIEEFWRWPEPLQERLWLSPVAAYQWLWDSLNAPRGYGWAANPWVVALTFTVTRANIDLEIVGV